MDEPQIRELTRLLQRPGAVAPADDFDVVVRSVSVRGASEGDELVIEYSVQPRRGGEPSGQAPSLPDGVARQPLPRDDDLVTYAAEVAQEVQGWATEHVRKFRPLPPPDVEQIRRDLPVRDDLWRLLQAEFSRVRTDDEVGFNGTDRYGTELRVVLTPEQWQDYVVNREIGCRNDYGVDADSAGGGLRVALDDVDEALATLDADESFLVLEGNRLVGSMRAELPAVAGSAGDRGSEEILRGGGGKWFAEDHDGSLSEFPGQ